MTNKTLVLFDFDGTLCKIDSFTGFYQFCFGKTGIAKKCASIFPNITRYYLGAYPAHLMRPLLSQQLLKGQNHEDIDSLAKIYSQQLIQHQINSEVLSRLNWHKIQGHQICLVSAGLDLYLKYIADHLAIDLICTTVQSEHGILTGKYISQDCSQDEKSRQVCRKYPIDAFSNIYAYGNSHEDYAMFRLAQYVTWVDPEHQLHHFKSKL